MRRIQPLVLAAVGALLGVACHGQSDAEDGARADHDRALVQRWSCKLSPAPDDQSLVTAFEIEIEDGIATGHITPAPDGDPIELDLGAIQHIGKMTTAIEAEVDFINTDEGVAEELAIVLFESSTAQASIAYTLDDFAVGRAVESYACKLVVPAQ